MAEFMVNPEQLRHKMEELQAQNEQLKAKKGELQAVDAQLATMWEGDAQKAFDNAVKQDLAKIDEFIALINEYCRALSEIIAKYADAENRNIDTATTRTY